MNELMQKVVEKFNISAEKAPEVYEALKNQYTIYEICDTFITAIHVIFLISLGCSLLLFHAFMLEKITMKKMVIILIITALTIIILFVTVYTIRDIYASDIIFLNSKLVR